MGMIQKVGNWVPYELKPKDVEHHFFMNGQAIIHGDKIMLCIWWDQLGVVYYELQQPNERITGENGGVLVVDGFDGEAALMGLLGSVVPARISSQSAHHCWRSPLPHALALIQRDFGCVLGVQQTKQLPHVAKVDLRKIRRASWQGKQFNLAIDEEPLDNAGHVWSRNILLKIWLWASPESKEGQLAPTPRICSVGCLKYQQYVLEECESDILYRPIP
ncbi:hypothetical protein LAZ67_X001923 [Cordylochernes scorpioides]|uniref:Uncharacterized protein n=1 Tax=Cordylochernes scorpioides TaxID=51811 RepID=A0ABY6LU05_9ARAC|nr:hypothetical protein LAZ67_X001923 [Cordylochernes scorpioides]